MEEKRRYFYLDLPGETICLDVPAIPPTKAYRFVDAARYPTNMVYCVGPIQISKP